MVEKGLYRTVWMSSWRGGTMGRVLYLRSTGRGFKSYSGQSCVTTFGKLCNLCASVTKQYNLVPANVQ